MIRTLTEMAEACRAREPQVRPTFADAVRKLGEAVLAHPDSLRDMFLKTGMLHGGFREMQASMLPDIAEGLLKIDAPAQALEVLDSIKEEERSNKVFVLKGTSLSLLDRDQEALAWFQRALKNPMEDRERLNCLSEYALSLKRVGRLKEAEEIYSDLLRKAKESQLAQIVVNLASVYSEGKEHQKAADLLLKFVRTHQNEPLAYATLGNAYAALGRFQEAAPQYQQALFWPPISQIFKLRLPAYACKSLVGGRMRTRPYLPLTSKGSCQGNGCCWRLWQAPLRAAQRTPRR